MVKMNSKKMMMAGAAAMAVVALAGVSALSTSTLKTTKASGTTYSETFDSTHNTVSTIGTSESIDSKDSPSGSGSKYYYSYRKTYEGTSTGYGSSSTPSGINASWVTMVTTASASDTMTFIFSMSHITKMNIGHNYTPKSAFTNASLYTSSVGIHYEGQYITDPTEAQWSSYTGSWSYGYDFELDSDGSKNYQSVKIVQVVPAGMTFGMTFSVSWVC